MPPASPPDPRPAVKGIARWAGRRARTFFYSPGFPKFSAKLVLAIALLLLFDFLPPFGMEEAGKVQAGKIMQRVLSPFHAYWTGGEARDDGLTAGQKRITVVTIDPAYFKEMKISPDGRPVWPLPVRTLIRTIVGKVVDAGPRAVMLDLAFPVAPREISPGKAESSSESAVKLAEELQRLNPGMPLLIGEGIDPVGSLIETGCGTVPYLPEERLAEARVSAPELIRGLNAQDVAGPKRNLYFVNLVSATAASDDYALTVLRTGPAGSCAIKGTGVYLPSPALALFKFYMEGCRASDPAADPCRDRRAKEIMAAMNWQAYNEDGLMRFMPNEASPFGEKLLSPLSLQWGINLSPWMAQKVRNSSGGNACASQVNGDFSSAVWIYLRNLVGMDDMATRRCVFIDNISAADLADGRFLDRADGKETISVADAFLKDRVVLIGAAIPQALDSFESSVNGELPGVFQHAVALENLLSWGSSYHWSSTVGGRIGPQIMVLIATILLAAFLKWVSHHSLLPLPAGRWQMPVRILSGGIKYVALPLLLFAIGLYVGIAYLRQSDMSSRDMVAPIIIFHLAFLELFLEWLEELSSRVVAHYRG